MPGHIERRVELALSDEPGEPFGSGHVAALADVDKVGHDALAPNDHPIQPRQLQGVSGPDRG